MNKLDQIPYCPFSKQEIPNCTGSQIAFAPCLLTECMAFRIEHDIVEQCSGAIYVGCKCLRLSDANDGTALLNAEVLR